MNLDMAKLESKRLALQANLDRGRKQADRNRLGQFATPTSLALDIVRYAKTRLGEKTNVRFIDPAIGTGSFYSALLSVFPEKRIERAVGYEIDPYYGTPAAELWRETGLDFRLEDFTRAQRPEVTNKLNLLICNPPYVRHHHIGGNEKRRLQVRTREASGIEMNGLAGLYCYFLGLCHEWMEDAGLAGWLIPSEFMDVNYGTAVKRYLLTKVNLLHVHRFDPNEVQFDDALVSSAVVWFRKERPPHHHKIRFTYGGTLQQPRLDRLITARTLRDTPKWTRFPSKKAQVKEKVATLADFFDIKRGLATGGNNYFILSAEELKRRGLPIETFRPILPSPRYLRENEVETDSRGNPTLGRRLFLLDCNLSESEIKNRYPSLWAYLEEGKASGLDQRYLCQHRTPWYAQENRPSATFLCTYLGRANSENGRLFRFILNHSRATATNVYLMLYPKYQLSRLLEESPLLKRQIWEFLNDISPETMRDEGRVYGGGLHKLEPRELGNIPAEGLAKMLPESTRPHSLVQGQLLETEAVYVPSDRQEVVTGHE